ncbi:unnamed protein product [Lactuca virosa]|uniref:DDX21/DDX50 dimerisation domain-containing protein n=1 Tax=Lactuca virosa TaxID=75947 RepID=A0AAU9M9F7_9ASTR|nr:unnamed protein product [Lactuca virosa]
MDGTGKGCCLEQESITNAHKVLDIMSLLGVHPDETTFGYLVYLYATTGLENKMIELQDLVSSVIPVFKSAAEELLNTSGLKPVELLAKALAKSIGYTKMKHMSLLSSMENHVTLHLEAGRPVYTPS